MKVNHAGKIAAACLAVAASLTMPGVSFAQNVHYPAGKSMFDAQCAVCHVPELRTGKFSNLPQLSDQVFHAYTDLLLHDMGDELADGRPDFAAGPRDWRTPALWGLGLSQTVSGGTAMLHDARAHNVVEAILWHGGEAEGAREAFRAMTKQERDALIRFVEAI